MVSEMVNRLRDSAKNCGGVRALARKSGVNESTLTKWLAGSSEPKASGLVAIATAANISLDWLLRGQGPMMAGGEAGAAAEPVPAADGLDEELMGRVVDGISMVYKEERVGLSGVDLGRLAASMYSDVVAADLGAWDEKLVAVKVSCERLRRELRSAPSPDQGKLSA